MSKTDTPDAADFDIEAMMAELDLQDAEAAAAKKAETATPAAEPEAIDAELDAAIMSELASADFSASLETSLEPTAADKLNAEQDLDLQEVFTGEVAADIPAAVKSQVESVETVAIEADEVIAIEPDQPITLEDTTAEVEVSEAPALENRSIAGFAPRPEATPERSEESISALTAVKYRPDVEAFNRDIAFTDATLDQAMSSQASLVAYQNERAARAAAHAARMKLKFDSTEATLSEAYRQYAVDNGEKYTEKSIENRVRKDSRWRKAKEEVIEAEMYADIHKGFSFALKDRNDMLIQKGSHRRQEMQGQMRFMQDTQAAATQHINPSNRTLEQHDGAKAAMAAMRRAAGQ